jgi:hypothetical protein
MPLSTYKNLMENQFSILKFSSEVFMQEPDFKPISMKKYFLFVIGVGLSVALSIYFFEVGTSWSDFIRTVLS